MSEKRYDLQLMISISRGNDELVRKMIRLFLRNTPVILNKLEDACKEGDFTSFRNLLNEIRPSFGYFNIQDVRSDLEVAEKLAYTNLASRELIDLMKRIKTNAESAMRDMEEDLHQPGFFFQTDELPVNFTKAYQR